MSKKKPSPLFNGLIASIFLRQERLIRKDISKTLPILSQNDITVLLFIFELVWKKQYDNWIVKYKDVSLLKEENFNPIDQVRYSIRQISFHTGVSKTTVTKSLVTLSNLKIIEVHKSFIYVKRNPRGISNFVVYCNSIPALFKEYEEKLARVFSDN